MQISEGLPLPILKCRPQVPTLGPRLPAPGPNIKMPTAGPAICILHPAFCISFPRTRAPVHPCPLRAARGYFNRAAARRAPRRPQGRPPQGPVYPFPCNRFPPRCARLFQSRRSRRHLGGRLYARPREAAPVPSAKPKTWSPAFAWSARHAPCFLRPAVRLLPPPAAANPRARAPAAPCATKHPQGEARQSARFTVSATRDQPRRCPASPRSGFPNRSGRRTHTASDCRLRRNTRRSSTADCQSASDPPH